MTISADDVMRISPVMPVIVIEHEDSAVPLAEALVAGGIRVLEITLRTPAALNAVERIRRAVPEAVVGVGTVTNAGQLQQSLDQGAQFAISPGLTPALLSAVQNAVIPFIPGIATVSELMAGLEFGLDRFKFFPAAAAGGVAMLKSFAGPFADVGFCPTGGINAGNFLDYLALPNVICVGGSWIVPQDCISKADWKGITQLAHEAVSRAQSVG